MVSKFNLVIDNFGFTRKTPFVKDEFLKQSTLMFLATMVGSGCSYLYQVYVGRALGPEGYAVFGSLFAIFYLVSVFAGAVQAGGARFISKFSADDESDCIGAFIYGLMKKAVAMGAIGFAAFYVISPSIASFLKIESVFEVMVLGTIIIFSLLLPATQGALQGLQRFDYLAAANVLVFGGKLMFGVILINLGFGVSGALGAVTMAMIVTIFFSLNPLRPYLKQGRNGGHRYDFKELYVYSVPTILVMFCLAAPSNLDVILAKHFFDGHDAGLYTAASVLGKIVLFASGAICIVMFPKASKMSVLGQNSRGLLNKGLMCTGLISGSFATLFVLFPELVGSIFGSTYLEATPLITVYAIMMFLFSLIWVIAQYCLATHNLNYAYILFAFTFAEMSLIFLVHDTIMQMIELLVVANLLLLLISYGYVTYTARLTTDSQVIRKGLM